MIRQQVFWLMKGAISWVVILDRLGKYSLGKVLLNIRYVLFIKVDNL